MLASSGDAADAAADPSAYADRMLSDPATKKVLLDELEARLAELAAVREREGER